MTKECSNGQTPPSYIVKWLHSCIGATWWGPRGPAMRVVWAGQRTGLYRLISLHEGNGVFYAQPFECEGAGNGAWKNGPPASASARIFIEEFFLEEAD